MVEKSELITAFQRPEPTETGETVLDQKNVEEAQDEDPEVQEEDDRDQEAVVDTESKINYPRIIRNVRKLLKMSEN